MGVNIPLTIFYIVISVLSALAFLYEFTNYQKEFICSLEVLVLPGAAIYYGYLASREIMGNNSNTTSNVIYGWLRYTLNFAFSAKFLFCLITCIFVIFINKLCGLSFKVPFRKNTTLDTMVLIYIYGILPLANVFNLIKFIRKMKVTQREDITAIFILTLVWFIYYMIMLNVVKGYDFGKMIEVGFAYTFLGMFIVISALPLHDYFFLYNTQGNTVLL